MGIKGDIIKIKNNVEIKIIDLVWLVIILIINVNYILASVLAKKGKDLTIELDNIIPFSSYSLYILVFIYCNRFYIYISRFKKRLY